VDKTNVIGKYMAKIIDFSKFNSELKNNINDVGMWLKELGADEGLVEFSVAVKMNF